MLQLPDKYSYYLNEDFLKEIFSHSSDGIIFFNKEAKIVECNIAFELLSGYSRNELMRSDLGEIFHYLGIDGQRIIDKVQKGERAEIRELKGRIGKYDGCVIPTFSNNTLQGGVLIFSPASEEKFTVSKQELYYSEQRFQLIAKATNNAMYDWNFETNALWFNEIFIENFGFCEKDLTKGYEFWKNHIHPEDRESVVSGLEDAIAKGEESWKDNYRFLNRSGYYSFIMDRGYIIHSKDKKPIRMVGAMIVVSDVQRIEKKLKQSQENYRFLAESMPQLVWITNPDGELIYANRKWTDYTGQEFDQYSKMEWTTAIHPDDYTRALEKWTEYLALGFEYKDEYRLRNSCGEYRWFLSRAIPMKDEKGNILKWIGTSTDIHDEKILLDYFKETRKILKKLNRNLNIKNEELKHINKELDNFVFAASHDLRSPVRNIESLLELLFQEVKNKYNPNVDYYLDLLFKSIQNLKITIQDLTEVAKIEEGRDKEKIVIRDVINEVLFSVRDHIDQSKAIIQVDLEEEVIYFSPKNLRSILFNLILNSIKYRSPDRIPVVKVSSYLINDRMHVLSVEDNGMGIRKEDLPKVFTPFKRIHYQVEGSGMGMSIVKRIVDNNHGKIEIDSELGKGTTVKVYLPVS